MKATAAVVGLQSCTQEWNTQQDTRRRPVCWPQVSGSDTQVFHHIRSVHKQPDRICNECIVYKVTIVFTMTQQFSNQTVDNVHRNNITKIGQ